MKTNKIPKEKIESRELKDGKLVNSEETKRSFDDFRLLLKSEGITIPSATELSDPEIKEYYKKYDILIKTIKHI